MRISWNKKEKHGNKFTIITDNENVVWSIKKDEKILFSTGGIMKNKNAINKNMKIFLAIGIIFTFIGFSIKK